MVCIPSLMTAVPHFQFRHLLIIVAQCLLILPPNDIHRQSVSALAILSSSSKNWFISLHIVAHYRSSIKLLSTNSTAQAVPFQDCLTCVSCHFHFFNCRARSVSKCVDQSQYITHWEIISTSSSDIMIGKEWVRAANRAHHSTLCNATLKVWQNLARIFRSSTTLVESHETPFFPEHDFDVNEKNPRLAWTERNFVQKVVHGWPSRQSLPWALEVTFFRKAIQGSKIFNTSKLFMNANSKLPWSLSKLLNV